MSCQVLNSSKDRASTASLVIHCLITFQIECYSPLQKWGFLYFCSCSLPLTLSLGITKRSLAPSLLLPYQSFIQTNLIPPEPSPLQSLPVWHMFQDFSNFWFVSLHSLTSAEETSLDRPSMCFMQLWMLLLFFASRTRCWLMVTLVPTRASKSFSAKLLSNQSPPAFTGVWGYSTPGEDLTFPLFWTS